MILLQAWTMSLTFPATGFRHVAALYVAVGGLGSRFSVSYFSHSDQFSDLGAHET